MKKLTGVYDCSKIILSSNEPLSQLPDCFLGLGCGKMLSQLQQHAGTACTYRMCGHLPQAPQHCFGPSAVPSGEPLTTGSWQVCNFKDESLLLRFEIQHSMPPTHAFASECTTIVSSHMPVAVWGSVKTEHTTFSSITFMNEV